MAHADTILEALRAVLPGGLTTAEIIQQTGIASRSSVYHTARDLMMVGEVRGEREGRAWRFYAAEPPIQAPAPATAELGTFTPASELAVDMLRSAASYQARYLVPLLTQAENRSWLMRKFASPAPPAEAANAQVVHFSQPLRGLLYADAAQAKGSREREDALIRYYNRILGLPVDFGLEHTWRGGSDNRLRLPSESGRTGWPAKHLKATISTRRQYAKAAAVTKLLGAEIDILLQTPRYLLLVQVAQPNAKVSLKRFTELRRYAVVLEHRLERRCSFGFIVGRPELLPASDLLYVLWSDIITRAEQTVRTGGEDA
ncbi:MAG: helix-turn-helix transcriptional regulator [Chloroflexi bacterium]|nr:helix-turn-helix transcriptional regulator [Chloroflexota bacterium]